MSWTIRRAGPDDAEALSALSNRLFVQTFVEELAVPYPPADLAAYLAKSNGLDVLRARIADPRQAAWIAETDGAAIGVALAGPADLPHPDIAPGDGMLNRLYVDRDQRGGGLAVDLMACALDWLECSFPGRLWLGVYSRNLRAQRFYVRHGFAICGEYDDLVGAWRDREYIMRRPRADVLAT